MQPFFSVSGGRDRESYLFFSTSYEATNLILSIPASWSDQVITSHSPYFQITSPFRVDDEFEFGGGTVWSMGVCASPVINVTVCAH